MAAGEAQNISMMRVFSMWSKGPETGWCCLKTVQTFTRIREYQPGVKRSLQACNIRLHEKTNQLWLKMGEQKMFLNRVLVGLTAAGSRRGDVTGSQPLSNSAWLVDNFTDQLWLCCFINSISRLQLTALLLGAYFTNSLSSRGWEWCQQRERKKKEQHSRQDRGPFENSAVIALSH